MAAGSAGLTLRRNHDVGELGRARGSQMTFASAGKFLVIGINNFERYILLQIFS